MFYKHHSSYQQTFIEWRAKIVLEVGNQIIFVVVVRVRLIQQFRLHRVMFQESSEYLVWCNVLDHHSTMNQV